MKFTLHKLNLATGKLVEVNEGKNGTKNNLEPGRVLVLNGYDCPEFVVLANLGIDPKWSAHGARYRTINLEKGGVSIKSASDLEWLSNKKDNRIQVYITDKVLTGLELEVAVETATATAARLEAEAKAHEAAKERERKELPALYPWLKPGDRPAANIKRDLKKHFPGIKFSVRSDHNSVNIRWDDGPSESDVNTVVDKYSAGRFDGMIDLYEYDHDNTFGDVFGAAKYIFCRREYSPELLRKAAESLGTAVLGEDVHAFLNTCDGPTYQRIFREAHNISN